PYNKHEDHREVLCDRSLFDAADVQPGDHDAADHPDQRPGQVHGVPGHFPYWDRIDFRENIGHRTWERDGFERHDRDISANQGPRTDERKAWSQPAQNILVNATG